MKTKFTNWGYVHYRLVKDYESKFDLSKYSFTNFNRQFSKLKEILQNPYNLLENSVNILSSFSHKLDLSNSYNHLPKEIIDKLIITNNQFVTIKNIHTQEYEFVQKNIFDILGLDQETIQQDWMHNEKRIALHHPDDYPHYLRYAYLTYFIISLNGFKYVPYQDFYKIKFRLGVSSSKISEIKNKKYVVVNRNSYIDKEISENNLIQKNYKQVEVWEVTDNLATFRKVEINYVTPGNHYKGIFLRELAFICNAKLLGISVKEVVLLHFCYRYTKTQVIYTELNKYLGEKNKNSLVYFSTKSIQDAISRLKSKIKRIYKTIFINLDNQESINNQSMLKLADKMGLLDIDQYLLDNIVSGIEFKEINRPTSFEK